jgi:hypothetical protein
MGDRVAAGELVRRVQLGLQGVLRPGDGFERARVRPIVDQQHLERTCWYIQRQRDSHGCGHDPFHEASNLPDLLGLRVCGAWTGPRLVRSWGWLGRRCGEDAGASQRLESLHDSHTPSVDPGERLWW